jgi:hypothetical protein
LRWTAAIRTFLAGDVDVLEGRRTVMEVRSWSSDYREYDVRIYFD